MKTVLLYALIPFLASFDLLAIVGSERMIGGEDWVCQMIIQKKDSHDKGYVSTCSSSLIASRVIMTAAHCLNAFDSKKHDIRIYCGAIPDYNWGQEPLSSEEKVEAPINIIIEQKNQSTSNSYREEFRGFKALPHAHSDPEKTHSYDSYSDSAYIVLDRPSLLRPVPLVTKAEHEELDNVAKWQAVRRLDINKIPGEESRIAETTWECRASGFGKYDGEIFGKFFTMQVKIESLFYWTAPSTEKQGHWRSKTDLDFENETQKDLALNELEEKDLEELVNLRPELNTIRPGDSGGPLYCRSSAQSPWKLFGVAHSGGYGKYPPSTGKPKTFFSFNIWSAVEAKK